MSRVRVRFAPSPTGFLHVGGARTAIFNWLYARHHDGVFVVRIEDTDLERSSGPMTQQILDAMDWLGLAADEGPFHQAAERERHEADARRLLEAGHAYRCFCSAESIKAARESAGQGYMYPRTCRDLAGEEADRRASAGEPFAVRFKVPTEGTTAWNDEVHRRKEFRNSEIEDFVILRSDGSPTYMLSVVSDDVAMQITHVIRGDDHISNTPKQILIYEALGETCPTFAHLPLILGEDKKRLSKRHGAVSIQEYRDQGYLPQAMFNFLSLLGWSPGDDRQKLDRDELIREFGLKGVGRSGAVFDLKKLEWLNGEYLADMAMDELEPRVRAALEEAGLWRDAFAADERERFHAVVDLLRSRARFVSDFVEFGRPLLDPSDELSYDEAAAKKHLKGEALEDNLRALRERLAAVDDWTPEPLEAALRAVSEERGVGAGKLIHPTRLAMTGRGVSPGIFEVLEVLGRERSLRRLDRMIEHVAGRGSG